MTTTSNGFNLTTLACKTLKLDKWKACFGPNDAEKNTCVDEENEEEMFWFAHGLSSRQDQLKQAQEGCNPNVCRMNSAICINCSRNMEHCTCNISEPVERPVLSSYQEAVSRWSRKTNAPLAYDPSSCKQTICGDCSRCTKHCSCIWEDERPPLRSRQINQFEDAFLLGLNRQRSSADLKG